MFLWQWWYNGQWLRQDSQLILYQLEELKKTSGVGNPTDTPTALTVSPNQKAVTWPNKQLKHFSKKIGLASQYSQSDSGSHYSMAAIDKAFCPKEINWNKLNYYFCFYQPIFHIDIIAWIWLGVLGVLANPPEASPGTSGSRTTVCPWERHSAKTHWDVLPDTGDRWW